MFLYLLTYSKLCVRGGLHWDELFDLAGAANGTYIAAGRWGLALYRWVFGVGYMPWISGVIAGIYIAVALVLQTRLLKISSMPLKFVYGAFYIGSIQWASQLQYSHQSDAVGLALLCVTLAAYWYGISKRRFWFPCVMLVAFASSVYQTAMLYFVVLLCAGVLVQARDAKLQLRDVMDILLITFVSGCLYLLSRYVTELLPLASSADVGYMRAVQHSMTKWCEIASAPAWSDRWSLFFLYSMCFIKVVVKNILGLTYEGQWVYTTAAVPVCCLVIQWTIFKKEYLKAILCLCIWGLPFAMCLVLMTDQGARVSLAEPLSVAILWAVYLELCPPGKSVKWGVLILSAFVLLKGGYRVSGIAEDEKNVYQSKMENLRTLNSRLLSVSDAAQLVSPRILYFGTVPAGGHNPYLERWNRRRDNAVLMVLPDGTFPAELTVALHRANAAEKQRYAEIVEAMPSWPDIGCIAVHDNVVLLRFED